MEKENNKIEEAKPASIRTLFKKLSFLVEPKEETTAKEEETMTDTSGDQFFFPPHRHDPYSEHQPHYQPSTPNSSQSNLNHNHHNHHNNHSPRSAPHYSPRRLLTSTATPVHQQNIKSLSRSDSSRLAQTSAFRNYGLLITLENVNVAPTPPLSMDDSSTCTSTSANDNTRLCFQFCPDRNLSQIHPNSYAPAAFGDSVVKLGGGGSGVAVFAGDHPSLGEVVMKHGGASDLVELFSLSTVAHELKTRCTGNEAAARHIQQRIPEFRMIYISPNHLGENRNLLWKRLRDLNRSTNSSFLLPVEEMETSSSEEGSHHNNMYVVEEDETEQEAEEEAEAAEENFQLLKKVSSLQSVVGKNKPNAADLPPGVDISKSGTVSGHRDIAIMVAPRGSITQCSAKLEGDTLRIMLPEGQFEQEEACDESDTTNHSSSHDCKIRIHGDGYEALKAITEDLEKLMKSNRWKFTFGQKKIGGENPKTGNEWLYEAKLSGKLLDNLVTQKIKLVRDLVSLTTDEEQSPKVLAQIRDEMRHLKSRSKADDVSNEADAYVGSAIKKNFKSDKGRITTLMKLGKRFREHNSLRGQSFLWIEQARAGLVKKPSSTSPASSNRIILTPAEEIPAYHLGNITNPEALIGNTFQKAPLERTVLPTLGPAYWQALLQTAVQEPDDNKRHSEMQWKRLWTCGLADAGLHNLFLKIDRVWFFDLGEPSITSVPGFLTKFLFSFFHTLGMQERSDSGGGSDSGGMWVRRFEPNHKTKKLDLTADTSRLLAKAYTAFEVSLDRIVAELFDGDDSIRWILLQYITLQLVSDASFCLQKWTIKGGGRARDRNHQEGLEKWLWRVLWDIYVACDINCKSSQERFKVQQPPDLNTKRLSDSERMLQDHHISLIHELGFGVAPVQSHRDGFREERNSFQSFVNA